MLRRCVRNERAFIARRCAPVLLLLLGLLVLAPPSRAQIDLGPVTVGAGLRTSFDDYRAGWRQYHQPVPAQRHPSLRERTGLPRTSSSCSIPTTTASPTRSACWTRWRNSKYLPSSTSGSGRFLPPSDRANLYGPFYAHEWNVYTDGIQDGYPFVFQGRDNGVVYWGTFAKKVKVSAGAFDGGPPTGNPKSLGPLASRSISGIRRTATT